MNVRLKIGVVLATFAPLAFGARGVQADEREPARQTIQQGVTFLQQDAAKWRTERGCAT